MHGVCAQKKRKKDRKHRRSDFFSAASHSYPNKLLKSSRIDQASSGGTRSFRAGSWGSQKSVFCSSGSALPDRAFHKKKHKSQVFFFTVFLWRCLNKVAKCSVGLCCPATSPVVQAFQIEFRKSEAVKKLGHAFTQFLSHFVERSNLIGMDVSLKSSYLQQLFDFS